jgi:putative Holliday junction resolvase
MPSYLALDYGTRRVGLAHADELGIPRPLPAITKSDPEARWLILEQWVAQLRVTDFVLGWPLREDGSPGSLAKEIEAFEAELVQRFGRPVHRIDEFMTSQDAAALSPRRKGGGQARARAEAAARKSGEIDSRAAAFLLRDWLG